MASLTDQLPGVNSGKQIVNPGPAAPSVFGALADFASGAVPGLAKIGEDREKARADAALDEAAQLGFDTRRKATQDALAVESQKNIGILTGAMDDLNKPMMPSDVIGATQNLVRAARGVAQGRMSQSRYDLQLEAGVEALFQKFPEQRAEISNYMRGAGLEHYMFRAFNADMAAYDNEQAAQTGAIKTQFDYAASRGYVTNNTSLEDGAYIGRELMANAAKQEALKAEADRVRADASLAKEEREERLKTLSNENVNSIITGVAQSVQPVIDQTALALTAAGTDAERQTALVELKGAAINALAVAETRAMNQVAAINGDEAARKAVTDQFKMYRDSIEVMYNTNFEANTTAVKNMGAAFNMTAGKAAPIYSRMVALIGQPAANALFADPTTGLQQMAPEVIASVKQEMHSFDPTSERGTASLARMIGYLRGQTGLQDLSPEEAPQYIRANGVALNANQKAVLSGDTTAVPSWMANYGNMTEAMIELGMTTTTAAGVKTATGHVATPAARQALAVARSEDPEYGAALTQASRAAAAKGLEVARGIPVEGLGAIYKVDYNANPRGGSDGFFQASLSRAEYDRWRGAQGATEGVAAAFGAAPGLAGTQRIPTYEEMLANVPQPIKDKVVAMNANLVHLVETDAHDPAIPSTLTPRERRTMYATGRMPDAMKKADGATQAGEWERLRNGLSTEIQNLLVGTTSQPLPTNELQSTVKTRGEALGLPWGLVNRVVRRESTWNPNAENTKTQARGLFQINDNKSNRSLDENINDGLQMLKSAQGVAQRVLGREPQDWQVYVAHQQGSGGGAALLNPANAAKNAVEVLTPLYPSADVARQAVTNNGGRADMSVSQFLATIKGFYEG